MKKKILGVLSFLFSDLLINISVKWSNLKLLEIIKKLNNIQLSNDQIKLITDTVKNIPQCKFLVFGLGNDSKYWQRLNKGSLTIFIEDNKDWIVKVTKRNKNLKSYYVNYNTTRKDWKKLLGNLTKNDFRLPEKVLNEKWDVILVDAPNGDRDDAPGRMLSIFSSSLLIKLKGHVFVHDCNREVEDVFSNFYLKKINFIKEIKAKNGTLRHYYIKGER